MKSFQQNIVSILTSINTLRIFSVISLLFLNLNSFGGNYTWSGGTSTSWTTTTNWTPNGNPSTNDSVTIKKGTFNCLLGANTTVKQFTLTADTIDLGGNTLTVSNNLTFTAGFITNGTLTCNGTGTASLGGGTIDVTLNVTGNSIQFSGGTFNFAVTAVKKGSGSSTGTGGCTFSSTVNLTDSGSGTWTLANSTSDTWNGKVTVTESSTGNLLLSHHGSSNSFLKSVTFKNTSTGNIYCDYYGTSSFHDSLIVNSTGGGDIIFGLAGGITTLDTSIIMIGTSGFSSSGELYLAGIKQLSATKTISLTATGTAEIRFVTGSEFDGRLTVSAPHLFLDGGRFNGVTTLTHTGTNTNSSVGLCYFADSTYITHDATGGSFYMSTTKVDTFDAPVTILNDTLGKVGVIKAVFLDKAVFINHAKKLSGVGTALSTDVTFLVGDAGSCTFHDSLTLKADSANIVFGTSAGAIDFKDSAYINIDSSYIGNLKFRNTIQHGSHAVNVPFQNNSGVLFLDSASTFNAAVTCHVKRVQLNGTTFNSSFYLIRNGTDNDTSAGGNTFNGYTTIIDSNSTSGKLLALANKYTDDFNGQATFKQYGSGKILPALTKNTTFAGDIVVDGNSDITFGYGGGKVILDDTSNRVLSKLGSYNPTFKKLEMKKNAGTFTLTMPLTVTDSVIFTKGYLITDSVHQLIIPDNGVVTGANDSSLVIGSVMKSGNDAFTFPIGVAGFYHPLSISAPTSGAFTASYIFGAHGLSTNADSTIENESLCEYWKVSRDSGTSKVLIRLGWNSNSCNVFGKDSMRVAVWDTSTTKWKDKGNAGTTGTLSVGTVISNDSLNLFGIIALADKFCTSLKPTVEAIDVSCPGNNDGKTNVNVIGATPPYSYSWAPRTGGSVSLWDLNSGTYFITVTDSRGCQILDSVEVNDPDTIQLSVYSTSSECHDSIGTAKIVATGGSGDSYHYFWTPSGESNDSIGGLPAGIYKVTVSDAKGCAVDTTIIISDGDGPEVEVDSLVNVDCYGNNSGFARIIFSGEPVEHDPLWPCNVPNPERIAAGTYPVMMEDDDGCFTLLNVTISEPPIISLSISTSSSQCGDSTGSATVIASGGTGSLTYVWSSGGTIDLETDLPSGFDTVYVTDENGCSSQITTFISDSDGPTITPTIINSSCFESNSGSINLSVSGGAPPYAYHWYPGGETTSNIDSLSAGAYMVVVIDSNGCKKNEVINVTMPEQLLAPIFFTAPSADTLEDGTAFAATKGGTPPYSYLWNIESQTTSLIKNLGLDDFYSVTVTDSKGCTSASQNSLINRCDDMSGGWGCNSNAPSLLPSDFPGYCYSVSCSTSPICTLSIADFGAIPDDLISDECAFEAANDYINALCSNGITDFVLTFDAGQYDIGRQDDFGTLYAGLSCPPGCTQGGCPGANNTSGNCCWYKKGHDIFKLYNLRTCSIKVSFEGAPPDNDGNPTTKFRFMDCMLYGSFDPSDGERYLPCAGLGFHDCSYGAYPGDMFSITNCDNITIKNLDLDGNVQNFSIGGYFARLTDGIQLGFDGISLFNSSSIFIENVNVHDFGRDGLVQNKDVVIDDLDLHLLNSKFNYNRRTGFAWCSGKGVHALSCEFNYNGIGSFVSRMAVGLDLEWEGGTDVALGYFTNCSFMFNGSAGVICDAPSWDGDAFRHHDFSFDKCTFVGSQFGSAIRPTGRNFEFTCCDFYGTCEFAYNGYNDWNMFPHPNKYNAKFKYSSFNEEYTDITNTTYCITPSGTWNPSSCVSTTVDAHPFMLNFFGEPGNGGACGRTEYDQCFFKTGYFNKFGTFKGNYPFHYDQFTGNPVGLNDQRFINCIFTNTGLDGTSCPCLLNSRNLGGFQFCSFIGTNIFNYPPQNSVRNWTGDCYFINFLEDIPPYSITNDCQSAVPPFIDPIINPIGLATTCYSKYVDPHDYFWQIKSNNSCSSLPTDDPDILAQYCINDIPTYLEVPDCYISSDLAPQKRRIENKNTFGVYPVPSITEVWLKNILVGDYIILHDILGNRISKINIVSESQLIDISKFTPGVYYISNSQGYMVKIIKM